MLTKAPAFKRQKNSRTEQHRMEIQKGNTFKKYKETEKTRIREGKKSVSENSKVILKKITI